MAQKIFQLLRRIKLLSSCSKNYQFLLILVIYTVYYFYVLSQHSLFLAGDGGNYAHLSLRLAHSLGDFQNITFEDLYPHNQSREPLFHWIALPFIAISSLFNNIEIGLFIQVYIISVIELVLFFYLVTIALDKSMAVIGILVYLCSPLFLSMIGLYYKENLFGAITILFLLFIFKQNNISKVDSITTCITLNCIAVLSKVALLGYYLIFNIFLFIKLYQKKTTRNYNLKLLIFGCILCVLTITTVYIRFDGILRALSFYSPEVDYSVYKGVNFFDSFLFRIRQFFDGMIGGPVIFYLLFILVTLLAITKPNEEKEKKIKDKNLIFVLVMMVLLTLMICTNSNLQVTRLLYPCLPVFVLLVLYILDHFSLNKKILTLIFCILATFSLYQRQAKERVNIGGYDIGSTDRFKRTLRFNFRDFTPPSKVIRDIIKTKKNVLIFYTTFQEYHNIRFHLDKIKYKYQAKHVSWMLNRNNTSRVWKEINENIKHDPIIITKFRIDNSALKLISRNKFFIYELL